MLRRRCDACGKEKDTWGGKTCEKGHFVCSACNVRSGALSAG